MRNALLALILMIGTGTCLAAEVAGVKLDDRVTVGGKELVLNGAGIRTRAFFKVYVAGLYLPAKATDASTALNASPRRVQLNIMRTLSADQLVDAFNEGLKENNTEAELAAIKPQTEQLTSIMKSFKEVHDKDVVTMDYVDGGTRIGLNGQAKEAIPGEAFNRALLKVWLGDHPVQADLRKAMLGG
jgi:long-chain acyl-CoA synthetase